MGEYAPPCLVCGKELHNSWVEAENQPNDGVYLETHGNYGSTVFDGSFDGERLDMALCDPCLVEAGEQGRVWTRKWRKPVSVPGVGVVGWERVNRPYLEWRRDLPSDDSATSLEFEELEHEWDDERYEWSLPLDLIRAGVEAAREEEPS